MRNRTSHVSFWLIRPLAFVAATAAIAFFGDAASLRSLALAGDTFPAAVGEPRVVDLSLLVAPEYPCTWPAAGFPSFHMNHYLRIGPLSAYNGDIVGIDGNTGTQLDVPPHSVPHPDTKLPNAGPYGRMWTDKVPAWQFCGEACVVDCRDLLESAPNGHSALVQRERIAAWERNHRPLEFGDVVLLRSGYSDKFYEPLPAGRKISGRSCRRAHAGLA